MILILRFYHLPADGAVLHRNLLRQKDGPPWESGILAGNLTKHEECVVAWGAVRLTRSEPTCEFLSKTETIESSWQLYHDVEVIYVLLCLISSEIRWRWESDCVEYRHSPGPTVLHPCPTCALSHPTGRQTYCSFFPSPNTSQLNHILHELFLGAWIF